ncbi:MAG: anthranilate phosphoribosyltransferase [Verrucomicrobiae bacterium]|nr:anthranilate phosphoribosyltransferase [Verrucomicrobiae bacterium]
MSFGQKLRVGNREATVFTARPMQELTEAAVRGELPPDLVASAATALLDETVALEDKAAFLSALSRRGETASEIGGFATAFLDRAVSPRLDRAAIARPLLDVCGTGGDKLNLFNVSTTAVFVLAACGVAVVKHGNRGITSKSGGADALEALGIRIDLPPEDVGRCLTEVGATFLFAPLYHPAFKAVAPVRKYLAESGQRTMFNLLGPLLNPARPDYQLIGVFDPAIGPVFATILKDFGRKNAWVIHGSTETGAGMDELSTLGPNRIWKTTSSDPVESLIEPSSLGLAPASIADLEGGDAAHNAALLTAILAGEDRGPKRDLVALNTAAGLVVTGIASDLREGLDRAREAIDSRAALAVLERWKQFA